MSSTAHKTSAEYVEHFDDEATLERKITQLADWVRSSRYFLAFTGAGISTSCGVPDFRSGVNTVLKTGAGAWTLRAEEQKTGRRVAQPGVKQVSSLQAIPSLSHMSLVQLQRAGVLKYLVSQNTDGLHRRSGFPPSHLAELHGNTNLERCAQCGKDYLRDFRTRNARGVLEHETGRQCGKCGGMLRDTIINFSESLPRKELRNAFHAAEQADLCLVLGSSLRVTPAANIPELVASKPRGKLVIVNLQATPLDSEATLRINAQIDTVMERLMDKLQLDIPPFKLNRTVQVVQWIQPAKGEGKKKTMNAQVANPPERKEEHSASSSSSSPSSSAGEKLVIQVQGIDSDGTPVSLFRSVSIDARVRSSTEPHQFSLRYPLPASSPHQLTLTLEPMGHYGEPTVDLSIPLQPHSVQTWALEYDPVSTGTWTRVERVETQQAEEDAEAAEVVAAASGLPKIAAAPKQREESAAKRIKAMHI